jgi:hypothetical protein
MTLSRDGTLLYVVNPDLGEIDELSTAEDSLQRRISLLRPGFPIEAPTPTQSY